MTTPDPILTLRDLATRVLATFPAPGDEWRAGCVVEFSPAFHCWGVLSPGRKYMLAGTTESNPVWFPNSGHPGHWTSESSARCALASAPKYPTEEKPCSPSTSHSAPLAPSQPSPSSSGSSHGSTATTTGGPAPDPSPVLPWGCVLYGPDKFSGHEIRSGSGFHRWSIGANRWQSVTSGDRPFTNGCLTESEALANLPTVPPPDYVAHDSPSTLTFGGSVKASDGTVSAEHVAKNAGRYGVSDFYGLYFESDGKGSALIYHTIDRYNQWAGASFYNSRRFRPLPAPLPPASATGEREPVWPFSDIDSNVLGRAAHFSGWHAAADAWRAHTAQLRSDLAASKAETEQARAALKDRDQWANRCHTEMLRLLSGPMSGHKQDGTPECVARVIGNELASLRTRLEAAEKEVERMRPVVAAAERAYVAANNIDHLLIAAVRAYRILHLSGGAK